MVDILPDSPSLVKMGHPLRILSIPYGRVLLQQIRSALSHCFFNPSPPIAASFCTVSGDWAIACMHESLMRHCCRLCDLVASIPVVIHAGRPQMQPGDGQRDGSAAQALSVSHNLNRRNPTLQHPQRFAKAARRNPPLQSIDNERELD